MRTTVMGCAILVLALAAAAQEDRSREIERLEREMEELAERVEILEGLAAGMEALEALGRERELEMLRRVAEEVRAGRGRREHGEHEHPEHGTLRHQIEVLRIAFETFEGMDGRKHDRIREALEHAIHARELRVAGRRDEEAQRVLRTQPPDETLVEILRYAEKLLRERKQIDRARALERALAHWRPRPERPREERRRDEAMHALEIAYEALGAQKDERNARIRGMLGERMNQRRRGEEWSREQTGQVLEILHHAERLLRERKKPDAADIVHRYREGLHDRWRRERPEADLAARVERLEGRVARLTELLERIVREIEEDER